MFNRFSGQQSNLVLSDSMFKNCTAKDTKWSCHKHVICMGNLDGVFQENTTEGHDETHKSSFFSYINK